MPPSPIRLIHTADIHLDACFAGAAFPPGFGNRRRQGLRDALCAILDRAAQWPADAILIAGDLYDDERVSRDTIAFCREAFAGTPIPILIAPGNHDPCTAVSAYARTTWPDNVHIFSTPTWTPHTLLGGRLVVHGFGWDAPSLRENPFGGLTIPADDAVHIAIGHGSERGHQMPDEQLFAPFDAADMALPGLRYLALGHLHKQTEVGVRNGTHMYYPGSPEGLDFKHSGMHSYLEVEIHEQRVEVRPVPSSQVLWGVYTLDLSEYESSQELIEALRRLAREAPLPLVARAVLTGECDSAFQAAFDGVKDAVADAFAFLDLIDRTQTAEDYEALVTQGTSLGAFIARMNEEVAGASDDAQRQLLMRAREVGLAAFRNRDLPVHGLERE
jgi:DNA repair exonuclease SbcCD nuclease subunit